MTTCPANPVIQRRLSQVELSHPRPSVPLTPSVFSLLFVSLSLSHSLYSSIQRLQELHLQENSIELLAEQALSGLSSLALLDLSRNHLRTLGPLSLKPLVSLQVLRVTGGL